MKKEFVPYEQALVLKELGFDELCIKYYWTDGMFTKTYEPPFNHNKRDNLISAPTFSQAFRWFREKHGLCSWTYQSNSGLYHYSILKDDRYLSSGYNNQVTYEEAELECLKKLIEIVKNK